jgi:hypothetical protein
MSLFVPAQLTHEQYWVASGPSAARVEAKCGKWRMGLCEATHFIGVEALISKFTALLFQELSGRKVGTQNAQRW